VQQTVGRRAREYCSNAHKQADYRKRRPVVDIAQLQRELATARMRIAELEQMVRELQGKRGKRHVTLSVQPVRMWSFIHLHQSTYDESWETMVKAAIQSGKLQPFTDPDGEELLDAHGQRIFWEFFHDVQSWQNCPDCPHVVKDSNPARKPSDLRPDAIVKGLPEGCMGIREFARMHGVNPTTFRDHITIGIGRGREQKDKVECCERPKQGRPNEVERYLTPEQQTAALDYWRRHGVRFTEGE
jgi:hypothetical protein